MVFSNKITFLYGSLHGILWIVGNYVKIKEVNMKKEDRHSGYFTFDQFDSIPHNIYGIGISPELLLNSTAQFYEMNEILKRISSC